MPFIMCSLRIPHKMTSASNRAQGHSFRWFTVALFFAAAGFFLLCVQASAVEVTAEQQHSTLAELPLIGEALVITAAHNTATSHRKTSTNSEATQSAVIGAVLATAVATDPNVASENSVLLKRSVEKVDTAAVVTTSAVYSDETLAAPSTVATIPSAAATSVLGGTISVVKDSTFASDSASFAASTSDADAGTPLDSDSDATFSSTTSTSTSASASASASPSTENKVLRDPSSLKGRFNYASTDCAAVVLKANREARGASQILNSKKDQYMLNDCQAPEKFVIVELCDDILIDTVVLGNYEFFSSTFRDLRLYVSDRYPPKEGKWTLLGDFRASNTRDAQVFPVLDSKIWARYLKVEILSSYGQEYYCPLTVLKVFGATQMEQFRKEEELELEEETLTVGVHDPVGLRIGAVLRGGGSSGQLRIGGMVPAEAYLRNMQGMVGEYERREAIESAAAAAEAERRAVDQQNSPQNPIAPVLPKVPSLPWNQPGGQQDAGDDDEDDEDEEEEEDDDEDDEEEGEDEDENEKEEANVSDRNKGGNGPKGSHGTPRGSNEDAAAERIANGEDNTGAQSFAPPSQPKTQQQQQQQQQQQSMQLPKQQRGGQQESIFKTIMRRLSRVERNITLAYHYLEEQHLVFRMVLQQVEMNNLENVQLAIRQLNHTTAKQMQSLTTLSEEVWRAILYDLEEYQQQTQADMTRMAGRLEFLAEEVLFEKRMNVAQLVLLLTIIVMITVNRVVTKLALIPESKKEK